MVEESEGDLMGDGVNIAARLEGVANPGGICISDDAFRQVKSQLDLKVSDLGPVTLKNIAEPIRVYSLEVGGPAQARPAPASEKPADRRFRYSLRGGICLPLSPHIPKYTSISGIDPGMYSLIVQRTPRHFR